MDPNSGRFVDEREAKAHMKRFTVGEVLKLKGEEFEVLEIQEREIRLKPLSAQERLMKQLPVVTEFMHPNRTERRRRDREERRKK